MALSVQKVINFLQPIALKPVEGRAVRLGVARGLAKEMSVLMERAEPAELRQVFSQALPDSSSFSARTSVQSSLDLEEDAHMQAGLVTMAWEREALADALSQCTFPEFGTRFMELSPTEKFMYPRREQILAAGNQRLVMHNVEAEGLERNLAFWMEASMDLRLPIQFNLSISRAEQDDPYVGDRIFRGLMARPGISESFAGLVVSQGGEAVGAKPGPVYLDVNLFTYDPHLIADLGSSTDEQLVALDFLGKQLKLRPDPFTVKDFAALGFNPARFRPGAQVWRGSAEAMTAAFGHPGATGPVQGNYNIPFEAKAVGQYFDAQAGRFPEWCRRVILAEGIDGKEGKRTKAHEVGHDLWFGGGLTPEERESFRKSVIGWVERVIGTELLKQIVAAEKPEEIIPLIKVEIEAARSRGDQEKVDNLCFFAQLDYGYFKFATMRHFSDWKDHIVMKKEDKVNLAEELFVTECFAYGVSEILYGKMPTHGSIPSEMRFAITGMEPSLFGRVRTFLERFGT